MISSVRFISSEGLHQSRLGHDPRIMFIPTRRRFVFDADSRAARNLEGRK
jgi:hypothetical protein